MAETWDEETTEEARAEAFGPGLGRAIRVIRASLDMSRKDLAERTGLSRSYVAELENDRKIPSSRALAALASALGVEPRALLEAAERWENEPPPHSYDSLRGATTVREPRRAPDTAVRRRAHPVSRLGSASSRRELLRSLRRGEIPRPDLAEDTLAPGAPGAPRETAPDPTAAVGDGDVLADAREVLDLFTRLDPEDRERVLDLARRLAGE